MHRFTRTDATGATTPDSDYAELTLAMRAGENPGTVFDALLGRGQIRLHPDAQTLREALAAAAAEDYAAGERVAVVAATREQAAALSAAVRDRLVTDGRVDDDNRAVVTGAGERIGVDDRIATRRNDRHLDIANRDVWTVTAVGRDGGLLVTPDGTPHVTPAGGEAASVTLAVTPAGTGARVLPADYVTAHVELAYATTAHGTQGDTVTAAHLVVGEDTGAAAAYVGMTRGRTANTAHLIAADVAEAREQRLAAFARDRTDLGPAHAADLAAREATRYAKPRPLEQALAELHAAWTDQQRCLDLLARQQLQHQILAQAVARQADDSHRLAALEANCRQAAVDAAAARQSAETSRALVTADTGSIGQALLDRWDAERETARQAARVVLDGPGRLGLRRAAVARVGERLTGWYTTWAPHLPGLPADSARLSQVAAGPDDRPAVRAALDASARRAAEAGHPEHAALTAAADAAERAHQAERRDLAWARRDHDADHGSSGQRDYARRLADAARALGASRQQLTDVRARIATLQADPAILAQPRDRLQHENDTWRARRDAAQREARTTPRPSIASERAVRRPCPEDLRYLSPHRTPGRGIGS